MDNNVHNTRTPAFTERLLEVPCSRSSVHTKTRTRTRTNNARACAQSSTSAGASSVGSAASSRLDAQGDVGIDM
eukprot:6208679-Pleurochrysis_carterae.AAC.3